METKTDLTRTSTAKHSPVIGVASAIVGAFFLFWVAANALSWTNEMGPWNIVFLVGGVVALGRSIWTLFVVPFTMKKANCPHCGHVIRFDTNLSSNFDLGRCGGCKHQLSYSNGNIADLGGAPPKA